jgi:hypothetical protein
LVYWKGPNLVNLMDSICFGACRDYIYKEDDTLHDAESVKFRSIWRGNLKADNRWMSSRIQAIIDAFNKQRDLDLRCSVIIFNEFLLSGYYADALEFMYELALTVPVELSRQESERMGRPH